MGLFGMNWPLDLSICGCMYVVCSFNRALVVCPYEIVCLMSLYSMASIISVHWRTYLLTPKCYHVSQESPETSGFLPPNNVKYDIPAIPGLYCWNHVFWVSIKVFNRKLQVFWSVVLSTCTYSSPCWSLHPFCFLTSHHILAIILLNNSCNLAVS